MKKLKVFSLILLALLFALSMDLRVQSSSETTSAKASPGRKVAQTLNPASGGAWSSLSNLVDVPVHISILPDGRLLYWGRDKGDDNWDVGGRSNTYVVDPLYLDSPGYTAIPSPTPPTNLFCSGHSFLPDGRLLAAGGHGKLASIPSAEGIGEKHLNIFDYRTSQWTHVPPANHMEKGRWYPYNVTLPNGETLIMAGTYYDEAVGTPVRNIEPTVRDLQGAVRTLRDDSTFPRIANYPYISLAPDGRVFIATPSQRFSGSSFSRLLDPFAANANGLGVFTAVGAPAMGHTEGTSVQYAKGKVLMVGGYSGLGLAGILTNTAEKIDLNTGTQWTSAGAMNFVRHYPTATLLPDGKVLVTGGTSCPGANNLNCGPDGSYGGMVQTPELWDPANPSVWTQMNPTTSFEPRVYHSIAMLMPDATVLVGGGGLPAAAGEIAGLTLCQGQGINDPVACRKHGHKNAEFFSPPYLFDIDGTPARRPAIASAPDSIAYGQEFLIDVGNVSPSEIRNAVLIRLPSVTHTYNQDQTRVDLGPPITSDSQYVRMRAPASGIDCPPGPYMLFLISNNGRNTPSVAKIVRVGDYGTGTWTNQTQQDFVAANSTNSSFTVTAAPGVSWTAVSTAPWVTINSGSSGTGSGTVSFTVAPNTTPSRRAASILVRVPSRSDSLGIDYFINQGAPFGDVPPTLNLYPFIQKISARGLTGGCGGGNFCVNNTITRGETAVFLTVLLINPGLVPNPVFSRFKDVGANHDFRKFITYVSRRGIIEGCGNNNFCPSQAVTRREMCMWLLRARGITRPPTPTTQAFSDVPLSDPAAPFIQEAVRRGITVGCGSGQFCPNNSITRGEMAVFIAQTFGM